VIDKDMPARVRVDSAKAILDRSGYVAAPLPAERDPTDITQLTGPELHALTVSLKAKIDEAEAKLATGARDVSPSSAEAALEEGDEDEGEAADRSEPC
jgi:hypothetical protein